MRDAERVGRLVASALPQLDLASLRFFAEGWDYEMWELDGELLVRVPKGTYGPEALPREVRILRALAGWLPVPIPTPEHVSDVCYTYRKLPGVPMNEALLSQPQRIDVARQLGRVMSELHRFPIARAVEFGLEVRSAERAQQSQQRFRERALREAAPLLAERERATLTQFLDAFVDDASNFSYAPRLVHADLSEEHILVDAATGALAGIIDFGDIRIGDPALDFAGCGDALRSHALETYELPVGETFARRADWYWRRVPLYLVFFGLEFDKSEQVAAGIEGIRERIVRGG